MMDVYPRLRIDLDKLRQNLNAAAKLIKEKGGCSLSIVTKGLCADPGMVRILLEDSRVHFLADSRVENIRSYGEAARRCGKQTVLLRLPMSSEIGETVRHADISFNSEIGTIRLLNEEAGRQAKKHKVVLMVDLGDLREGLFFREEEKIFRVAEEILLMENIEFYGMGVNLTCYGAIIPKKDNLSQLTDLAAKIEERFGIRFSMISGGNSSSIYLIEKGELPAGINNLRLGEAFLLGTETAYGGRVPGSCGDALVLEAEVIEVQEKPSLPIGEVGLDAFGQKPHYEDRGIIKRAILAVGKQDTDPESMTPIDPKIEILGGSSDHLILDVTGADIEYKVGDVVGFTLGYGAMLKAATSKYVEKVHVPQTNN